MQVQATNVGSVGVPHWDAFRDTAMGRYLLSREQGFIRRLLSAAPAPQRVLDVCCCTGRVTLPLRDLVPNVMGLDIDWKALTLFRARSSGNLAVMADGLHLPFADGSLDCVVAIQCLEYFDHWRFLEGCNRVLREGGLLVFRSVSRRSYKQKLRRLLRRVKPYDPSINLSTREVLHAVVQCGFEIEAVEGYNWPPFIADFAPLSNSSLVWAAALVEEKLQLGRYYGVSPWVLVAARKRSYQ